MRVGRREKPKPNFKQRRLASKLKQNRNSGNWLPLREDAVRRSKDSQNPGNSSSKDGLALVATCRLHFDKLTDRGRNVNDFDWIGEYTMADLAAPPK
jgi:hypothetical protein